jgi:diguanylate cyclase (GGDEF)-like protein/PAS domain S-box-containing protein
MAVMSDVTESERRERQLRESEAWFRAIVTGVTDYALMPIDGAGRIRDWNPSILRVTGFAAEQVIGQSYGMFYQPDAISGQLMLDRLNEADAQGWSLDEGWRLRADGTRFWGSILIAPLQVSHDAGGKAAVLPAEGSGHSYSLILRDISEQRDSHEALRRSVHCDHLTGLLNRRAFYDAAQTELQRWARAPRDLSVAVFDADHFKRVNDTYGHQAGDAVLRHLAAVLTESFRELDVVSRIGGEEFVVLLPGTSADTAMAVSQQVCAHVAARPAKWKGEQIACSVSVGVAAMQPDVPDLDALMTRADRALYAAKAAGRNRVVPWGPELGATR